MGYSCYYNLYGFKNKAKQGGLWLKFCFFGKNVIMLTVFYFISYHLGVIMVELLQIRGSIPLLWQQIVDLTYKPKFELLKLEDAVSV